MKLFWKICLFLLPIVFLLATTIPAHCQDKEETDPMKLLRFKFEVEMAEVEKPLQELKVKYRSYLEKQKNEYQEAGALEAATEVSEEMENIGKSPENDFSTYPELNRLQRIYRQQRKKLEDELFGVKLSLIQSYRKLADDLVSELTRSSEIEAAKLATAEVERLAAMAAELERATRETLQPGFGNRTNSFVGSMAGEEIENHMGMKLCWIPAGKFTMGSLANEPGREPSNEGPVEVELTRGFWLGKYEVTQEDYEKVTRRRPPSSKNASPRAPVVNVSWTDAIKFCERLTRLERSRGNLPDGWTYTLPTEAQWEFACRAGETGPYSGGSISEVAWFQSNSGAKTHEVGTKKANAWGLHDMHGNAHEWCLDWYADKLVGGTDPAGPKKGTQRAGRGGSWGFPPQSCRAARRAGRSPDFKRDGQGFRVCLNFEK